MPDTIEDRVRQVVADQFDQEDLTNDHRIVEDLGGDSLDLVELTLRLRLEFGDHINDLDEARTIGDVVNHIRNCSNG